MSENIWRDGMLGLITGDALGSPVQFLSREAIREWGLVECMEAGGTYNTPMGTWTDDSSLALATLDSMVDYFEIMPLDVMERFCDWYFDGKYTPFGKSFDRGRTCSKAIKEFYRTKNIETCGATQAEENGNGALMRILPVCIFCISLDPEEAKQKIYTMTGITHNHNRSKMASMLYYYLVKHIILDDGDLTERMRNGHREWESGITTEEQEELPYFYKTSEIIMGTREFTEDEIDSTGYVIHSLEAACWSLVTTESFKEALLRAVNLGFDADTIGAITGGLAGLYYGSENIPEDWISVLQRIDDIEKLCREADERLIINPGV